MTVAATTASDTSARLVLETVRCLAAELHPQVERIASLGLEDSLERDFGLDSLARVELGARLERATGAALPERVFAQAETPADLVRWLRHAPGARMPEPTAAPTGEPGAAAEELPEAVSTLIEALEWHVRVHPERTHMLLYGEDRIARPLTYADMRAAALEVAGQLVGRYDVAPGERVAIMLPTCAGFFAAFYGVLYAGAVPVPLYPPARPSQLEDHLRRIAGIAANAGAVLLITVHEARTVAALLRPLAPSMRAVVEVDALRGGTPLPAPAARTAQDIALLQYTSGSTGQPKGVVLTHANLLTNLRGMREACGATSADVFVSWLPLYHDMGLIGACMGAMSFGFLLVLMSPFAFLSRPSHWLRTLQRHRATMTAGPNFAYAMCAAKVRDDEIGGLDLSSVRLAFNGAEPVSPDTVESFAARFAAYGLRRSAITPVYGLAECSLGLSFPPLGRGPLLDVIDRSALLERGRATPAAPDARTPLRLLSCGRVLAGHAVRIVSADGEALAERVQGEIEFRGPSATRGYHENPQATAGLFDGQWLRTGDLGYLADGELFITGRTKDIIIRGGHNIHPQELEEAAARVPGVRKGAVAVFPARDSAGGTERLIVLAETAESDPHTRERIVDEIRHLAVDLIGLPADEVVLAPPHAVLKTSSGKIRRAACRERFERGEAMRAPSTPSFQIARLAWAGARARAAQAATALAARAWGVWACAVFVILAPLVSLAVIVGPSLAARRRIARAGARALFRLWFVMPRVTGRADGPANEPAADGAAAAAPADRARVIVANHASYLDGLLLTAVLPPAITFIAKQELAPQRFAGLLLRRLDVAFVDRLDVLRGPRDARLIDERLVRGEQIVVFAEGTFEREPGLLPLRMGAFVSAAGRRVPIVPVAIRGTRTMLPDDDLFPRPARLEVDIGAPMREAGEDWQTALALRGRTRAWLLEHTGEPDLET